MCVTNWRTLGQCFRKALNKIENGNSKMCQKDNNPTKEQKPAEGHQWVFNTARQLRTRRLL